MPRYRFAVEYLGEGYVGWQKQPKGRTLQQVLEDAFSVCLQSSVAIIGAGRTDAGVHAQGQVAHFDYPETIDTGKIERSVNSLTPNSVFIRRLEACEDSFHARYSAKYRYYQYTVSLKPTALYYPLVWIVSCQLDLALFAQELEQIKGKHDFHSFSIPRNDGKSTECLVTRSELEVKESRLIVHLQADRFLHKMVRSLVGACYDVARKYHHPGLIKAIFEKNFTGEHTWAPACGLCLKKAGYRDYEY